MFLSFTAGDVHELLKCLVCPSCSTSGFVAHVSVDHSVFALPDFDPNDYANAVLAGEPYPPQPGKNRPLKATGLAPASEDVSVAISKLTFSLDDVEKQLKSVVSLHVASRTVAKIAPSHSGRRAHESCDDVKGDISTVPQVMGAIYRWWYSAETAANSQLRGSRCMHLLLKANMVACRIS